MVCYSLKSSTLFLPRRRNFLINKPIRGAVTCFRSALTSKIRILSSKPRIYWNSEIISGGSSIRQVIKIKKSFRFLLCTEVLKLQILFEVYFVSLKFHKKNHIFGSKSYPLFFRPLTSPSQVSPHALLSISVILQSEALMDKLLFISLLSYEFINNSSALPWCRDWRGSSMEWTGNGVGI